MSRFVDSKYELDGGLIAFVRLSAEEAAAAGTEPSGEADLEFHAMASGSRNDFGIHTRGVRLSRNVGTDAVPNLRSKFLTVLTPAAFASDTFNRGATVTIDGVDWTVGRKINEALV